MSIVRVSIHWDPTKYAWRSYRVRVGAESAWFGLRSDAERWMMARLAAEESYSGL